MATENNNGLTADQLSDLLDILTHYECYKEIEEFKIPGAISNYGHPFEKDLSAPQAPILQTLLSKFALKLPGLKEVPEQQFWRGYIEPLIQELAQAELSESYDKGVLGIRKTLATADAALFEYPVRGILDFPREDIDESRQYDLSNPEDVLAAWQDSLQGMVYGNLIDRLVKRVAETDDLSQHESVIQGMHEFILINLASIMHYTLVLSPEGTTLRGMIESVHNLLPYTIMRQTLKIGNVATMLSALVRVVLAKASFSSVTNWMGLSSGADEGMNLMQQIISQVLGWDKRELRKRAERIEKDKDGPPKEVREELKDWIQRSREEHEASRMTSKEQNMSIVAVILSLSSLSTELTTSQHEKAMEYLSIQLSIRDRTEIVRVLCKRNPDLMTAAVRQGVDAYTPMIRLGHQAVNLAEALWDFERFVTDMLKVAKPKGAKGKEQPASVEDFADLLHRHQSSVHKFLHQAAKNGKEMVSWWQEFIYTAAQQFRNDKPPPPSTAVISDNMAMGGIKKALSSEFQALSEQDREAVMAELKAHHQYTEEMSKASAARISAVIKRTGTKTSYGPGGYLARWQQHLDTTIVTPATAKGPVRTGADLSAAKAETTAKGKGTPDSSADEESKPPVAPPSETTIRLFAERFRTLLATG